MALLFIDSFDHYGAAGGKYVAGGTDLGPGRHGNGLTGFARCALNPTSARVIVGAAYRFTVTDNRFLRLYDQGSTANPIADVNTLTDGSLQLDIFGGPTLISAADLIRPGVWHYLEVDVTVAIGVDGALYRYTLAPAAIRLDGAIVLTTASLGPTLAVQTVSAFGWQCVDVHGTSLTGAASGVMDDLYICDGSGPAPHNAPLGDVRIDVIRPNGAGATTAWTPTGGLSNWDAVNDATPDGDITAVTASTAGLVDLYDFESLETGNTILGAQLLINARRTAEGFAALTPLLRHAGVTYPLTTRAITSTYGYRHREVFVQMPNGDPLSDGNVNALQAGLRRES